MCRATKWVLLSCYRLPCRLTFVMQFGRKKHRRQDIMKSTFTLPTATKNITTDNITGLDLIGACITGLDLIGA